MDLWLIQYHYIMLIWIRTQIVNYRKKYFESVTLLLNVFLILVQKKSGW